MDIGKSWKIESDDLNVTIFKRSVSKKTGEDIWKVRGYYQTVKGALHGLVNMDVSETGLKDLATVVKKIDELEKIIDRLRL